MRGASITLEPQDEHDALEPELVRLIEALARADVDEDYRAAQADLEAAA